ncbi:kelch domain-containing protein 2-like isoform X3 [Mercenaria mercenaria]|nr:kelch domain-containing protein 2-like isoform X3 [Mercenaria mercenaria]
MIYHTDLDVGYWTQHETGGEVPPGTSGASAILLAGKMYIFGGHTEDGNTNTLYCLDLQKLTWKCLIPDSELLPSPRDKFAAWSYNNKLYYFGGFGVNIRTGDYLNENGKFVPDTRFTNMMPQDRDREWNNQLLVYDIDTNKWSNPKCQGQVPLPRAAHTAVRLKNLVYIFGGRHGNTRMNDLHSLELETLTWSGELYVEGACPCGRSWHTFTAVSDEVVFLYGGYSTSGVPLCDAWQLNVRHRQWSQITVPPNRPRLWHTSCCTSEGEILVFGGCENDIFQFDEPNKHANEVLVFQLQPYRLQRQCLQTVYKHYTSDKWCILPKTLQDWLLKKKQLEIIKSKDNGQENVLPQGSTCAVS